MDRRQKIIGSVRTFQNRKAAFAMRLETGSEQSSTSSRQDCATAAASSAVRSTRRSGRADAPALDWLNPAALESSVPVPPVCTADDAASLPSAPGRLLARPEPPEPPDP